MLFPSTENSSLSLESLISRSLVPKTPGENPPPGAPPGAGFEAGSKQDTSGIGLLGQLIAAIRGDGSKGCMVEEGRKGRREKNPHGELFFLRHHEERKKVI